MSWGPLQILVVLAIVLLLFGTRKLRNIGSDLGSAIKGFKKSMHQDPDDDTVAKRDPANKDDKS